MIYLTFDDVIELHVLVIRRTGGMGGLRDRGALEAALGAPMQTFGDAELFPTELEQIVRLSYGLAANHAFVDGNKRIGALALQLLLRENGYDMPLKTGELADMFISLAAGEAGYDDLLEWVRAHLKN